MKWFICVLGAVFFCLGGTRAHAADVYVAQDGQTPGDFLSWTAAASNIQDAVNAASAGDTVWVGDGVYRVPTNGVVYSSVTNIVYINKPLTVRGFSGEPADVIIDGEGIYRGINVYYNTSTTNRFLMAGMTVSNSYDKGILFNATANGIAWTGVVENCVVVDGKNGGGIYDTHYDGGRAIIVSNTVVRNNQGAGITVYSTLGTHYPSSLITDSIIEGNTNSGLSFHNGTHAISRCIIRGNTSPVSSGGLGMGAGTYSMDNCLVYNNAAAGIGGGIYKWSATGSLSINNCTIVSNLSTVSGPGGVRSSATNSIVNSIHCCPV